MHPIPLPLTLCNVHKPNPTPKHNNELDFVQVFMKSLQIELPSKFLSHIPPPISGWLRPCNEED